MNTLFLCTANGGRGVTAERLLRREAEARHAARSAGSRPGAAAAPAGRRRAELPDPEHEPVERVREIRDDGARRVRELDEQAA